MAMTKDEAIKALLEHYADSDFKRLVESEDDDDAFYIIDADLLDEVVGALGGKVKPDEDTYIYEPDDEDGDDGGE